MRVAVAQNATDSHAFSTAESLAGMRGGGSAEEEEAEVVIGEKPAVAKERPVQMTFFFFFFKGRERATVVSL